MAHRTPRPAEILAAAKILEQPAPHPRWRWDAACSDAPLDALPQEAEDQSARTMRARSFIGAYCGGCTVKAECIRDAFDTYTEAPDGVVLGGLTPGQAKIMWHAANGARKFDTVEEAVANYAHLEAETTKRAAARSAAAEAAAGATAIMPQVPVEAAAIVPPMGALASAPPQAA
jgi:hypothetical protein